MSSSSAPSRPCLDCGRAICVTRRYVRCESCRIAASPNQLQTQLITIILSWLIPLALLGPTLLYKYIPSWG
jgi:hypothetical protein